MSISSFLPAVLHIVDCNELGGVSALRLGPEETGESTDSSVSSQRDIQELIIGIQYIKHAYDMHAANKIYIKVHQKFQPSVCKYTV